VIVNRLDSSFRDRKVAGSARVNAGDRLNIRPLVENRSVQGSLKRWRRFAFDNFSAEIEGQEIFLFDQGKAYSGRQEKKIRFGDPGAQMPKALYQSFLGEDSARLDHRFFEIRKVLFHGPFELVKVFSIYSRSNSEGRVDVKVKVECCSGPKGEESPVGFLLGNRSIKVEVVDRWYGQQGSYYRVLGDDENFYILKEPVGGELWELVSFTHKDSRGTELQFEGTKELQ